MEVPFFKPSIGDDEIREVIQTMQTGWLTSGPKVIEFEEHFRKLLPTRPHVLATNSATSAAQLAFAALNIPAGSEVITTSLTFSSPAMMLYHRGVTPILVDVEPDTLNIDPTKIEAAITPLTSAIMVTHFAGRPCDMDAIHEIAIRNNLFVIEDAAHALPARYKRIPVGSLASDATFFSFYANKTMTTGEGGMLVMTNEAACKRAKELRLHGFSTDAYDRYTNAKASWEYDVAVAGFKANMTDLAAAIGVVQLNRSMEFMFLRLRRAMQYYEELEGTDLKLPVMNDKDHASAWHLFTVQVPEGVDRDFVINDLKKVGIHCSVHFKPLHQHTFWDSYFYENGVSMDLPVTNNVADRLISLPLYPSMAEAQVSYVCEHLRTRFGGQHE